MFWKHDWSLMNKNCVLTLDILSLVLNISSILHSRHPKKFVYWNPTYILPVLNMHLKHDS